LMGHGPLSGNSAFLFFAFLCLFFRFFKISTFFQN
jgi:hypothetical protein